MEDDFAIKSIILSKKNGCSERTGETQVDAERERKGEKKVVCLVKMRLNIVDLSDK